MLAPNRHTFFALCFIVPTALFAGCVVKDVDTDKQVDTTSNNSSANTSGSGGSGGTGQGGSGGASGCVDEVADNVITAAQCDDLAISPAQGATQCVNEPMQQGPGYRMCNWQFQYLHEGAIEYVYDCLDLVGVQNACDLEPAQTCIDDLYANLCGIPDRITQLCTDMATSCGANGDDSLDVELCSNQLAPFSDDGVILLGTCIDMADPMLTCGEAYDQCVVQALTF
jgi:hypothetical protein